MAENGKADAASLAIAAAHGQQRRMFAFDAGKHSRRLRSVPTTQAAINSQIRSYGRTVLARSRYLCANNPYAFAAKNAYVSALVGAGIRPSSMIENRDAKRELQMVFDDWSDECDADGITDFYGQQALAAGELFEAGEYFIRLRPRRPEDGLTVPLQLQLLQAEMLDIGYNQLLPNKERIECGIHFDAIGRRKGYWFWEQHPGNELGRTGFRKFVPASEVIHVFKPMAVGQIRGVPFTISGIAKLAILDQYDDAELERKRTAALFTGFVTRPAPEGAHHPLEDTLADEYTIPGIAGSVGLEPGAMVDLEPGEEVTFAQPADPGQHYEPFQLRQLLAVASGYGVPYMSMTGDTRNTTYATQRAAIIDFRRKIEADQHHIMAFQHCRPVWRRWFSEAVFTGAVQGISRTMYLAAPRVMERVRWRPPKWEWVDPENDIAAEVAAVDAKFKSRSDVIEASGYDPEEVDQRIADDQDRLIDLGVNPDPEDAPDPDDPANEPANEPEDA